MQLINAQGKPVQTGDILHVLCASDQRDQIADTLAAPRSRAEQAGTP